MEYNHEIGSKTDANVRLIQLPSGGVKTIKLVIYLIPSPSIKQFHHLQSVIPSTVVVAALCKNWWCSLIKPSVVVNEQ